MTAEERTPPGLAVREATAADNAALIALELESPIFVGDVEETFDRSPDFFAGYRVLGDHRVVLGEVEGRTVGVMAGVIQTPLVQAKPHRLAYIRQARVHPDFFGRRVAWTMANELFRWAAERRAEGPYYVISPGNERSLAFVERGGRRWPLDVTLLQLDVSLAEGGSAERLRESHLEAAVGLVNATHAGEEFFEPLTLESLRERLGRDGRYSLGNLYGAFEDETLVAVAGLWDRGAIAERIDFDRETGETTRSREAAVVDWGWATGQEDAFAGLLRHLAAESRALGRPALVVCEPSPGALPDAGLPGRRVSGALFTPTMEPPPAEAVRGLFFDMLCW
ncbi:MAG: GNAT family N-acetyltransferase [Dehalococcoidia bacterium]